MLNGSLTAGNLTVNSGTLTGSDQNWNLSGDLTIGASATVTATSGSIYLSGNWTNNGEFVNNDGNVVFYGPGTSTILGENIFSSFFCETAGKSLNFNSDDLQTFENWFVVEGAESPDYSGNIKINNLTSNVNNSSVAFATITNCDNTAGKTLNASFCVDGGGNTGWEIHNAYIWTGFENSDWNNPNNWSIEIIPDFDDDVLIYKQEGSNDLIITSSVTVSSFEIESGANVFFNSTDATLTVLSDFINSGTLGSFEGMKASVTSTDENGRIISGTIDSDGSVTLNASSININSTVSVSEVFTLDAAVSVTQSDQAGITAGSLLLLGIGDNTLNSELNDIGTLAVSKSSGTVEYTESNGFKIGTVNEVEGISMSDTLTLSSGGTVSQTAAVAVTDLELSGSATYNFDGAGTTVNGNLSISENTSLALGAETVNITGDWINNGSFDSGTGTVIFAGASEQNITSGGGSFYKIELNNSSGAVLQDSTLVNNGLTLTDGNLTLGDNDLTIGLNGQIYGSSGGTSSTDFSDSNMIITDDTGSLLRNINSTGNYLFPIGTSKDLNAIYSPVIINFSSGSFAGNASLEVNVVNEKYSKNPSGSGYLDRYWNINSSGISGFASTVSCYYNVADIVGSESGMFGVEYSTGVPRNPMIANSATHSFSCNVTAFGVFTGVSMEIVNPPNPQDVSDANVSGSRNSIDQPMFGDSDFGDFG